MNINRLRRQVEIATALARDAEAAVARGIPADQFLAGLFRNHPEFGRRDRHHYTHVIFAFFRWRGWAQQRAGDFTAQCAWAVALDPSTTPDVSALWQAVHPISPEAIQTARAELAADDLMPSWLTGVMTDITLRHAFIDACALRPPAWLSIEPVRVPDFARLLQTMRIAHAVDTRLTGAVAVHDRFTLAKLEQAWGSALQVQDIASQAVVAICQVQAGQSWWDACCGAGGKTLAIARATGKAGAILATDVRTSILRQLRERAKRHGCSQITATELDAAHAGPDRSFDGVLVDAPCSGIGTWPRNPDARWRTHLDHVSSSARKQQTILAQAATRVKPGGALVYSVCTMTPQEGQDIVEHFLRDHTSFRCSPFPHPLRGEMTAGTCTLWPSDGPGDGMFMARMIRQE